MAQSSRGMMHLQYAHATCTSILRDGKTFRAIAPMIQRHNAALRCEQRYHETQPYHRKHKTQRWNEKYQALGVTLKCFVMSKLWLNADFF